MKIQSDYECKAFCAKKTYYEHNGIGRSPIASTATEEIERQTFAHIYTLERSL